MINVTKPYIPNKEKYIKYVSKIFESSWLTNNGPILKELEERLKDFLKVKNIILVNNGSLALQVGYKALGLKGEVITTPFSFAATSSTLFWEGLCPVFADIDSKTYNINTSMIEGKITKKTSAIVPVHVFGNPCEVEEIDLIARRYNVKVLYDAAHAFDVNYFDKTHKVKTNILNFGDVSTISFHSTKLFHTIEGGAIVTKDDALAEEIRGLINFGIANNRIKPLGTNAKMNEFQAAMGLCILDEYDNIKEKRENLYQNYLDKLNGCVEFQKWNEKATNNHSYFPILLKNELECKIVIDELNKQAIYPRRYFYPSLDLVGYCDDVNCDCKVSRDISSRILCLPLFPDLDYADQSRIINIIQKVIHD